MHLALELGWRVRMVRVLVASIVMAASLALPSGAGGDTIAAASCGAADVQDAINGASNGDTVAVPAGRCVWAAQVTIHATTGITLRGAGIGQTTIVYGVTGGSLLRVEVAAGRFTRITELTFDYNRNVERNDAILHVYAGGLDTFRVDHNSFERIYDRGIGVTAGDGLTPLRISGLIDHNTFECPFATGVCQAVYIPQCGSQVDSFNDFPEALGSSEYVFFEDNVLNFSYLQDGGLEGYGCARYVARFNAYHGASQGHHGNDSGNRRGTHSFEIYNNTFDTQGLNTAWSGRVHHIRSGTGLVFNNTYTREVTGGIEPYLYRVDLGYPVYGKCDGSSTWDGNRGSGTVYPAAGWPCVDSPGWVFSTKAGKPGGDFHRAPVYIFGNRRGGDPYTAVVTHRTHIAEDAEFFNEKTAFDGTSGVGAGTRSQMNATACSKEYVGFWVTDEGDWNLSNGSATDGRLYVCRSNHWVLYYTPYRYPHPLQGTGVRPPSNVRIVAE